jgi:ATPase subunit of ABC transporter with duplicated ATPase domains
MRAEQMLLQQATMAKQAEKIAHLQSFINRFKAKASKAKQAQSRVKALERMEKIAPVLADAEFTFEFQEPQNLPNPMLSMVDTSIGYPPPEDAPAGTPPTVIVRNINRSVMAGQRIGILGANGQGKSTLVKTIARDLQAISRRSHRRQGPEHRLLRPAGTRRAAPAGHAARTHGPPGQGSHRRRPQQCAGPRAGICATSSAPSISAARWSSRPSAP